MPRLIIKMNGFAVPAIHANEKTLVRLSLEVETTRCAPPLQFDHESKRTLQPEAIRAASFRRIDYRGVQYLHVAPVNRQDPAHLASIARFSRALFQFVTPLNGRGLCAVEPVATSRRRQQGATAGRSSGARCGRRSWEFNSLWRAFMFTSKFGARSSLSLGFAALVFAIGCSGHAGIFFERRSKERMITVADGSGSKP